MSPSVTRADDDIWADWLCALCPTGNGWELELDVGPALVSDDDYRFGNVTGLDADGGYLFSDLYARYRDDNANYLVADGYLRGSAALGLFLRAGKQSRYELTADYQKIPRRLHGNTASPYIGTNDLTLPGGWVTASTTQGMSGLATSLVTTPIGNDFKWFGLGIDYQLNPAWDISVSFARREEQGRNRFGGGFLFNAIELASPVDYVTNNLDASIALTRETWQARLSYFGSTFENENAGVDWDNAYSVPFTVTRGAASLEPDNDAHRIAISGALRLPARTTLNASASVGRMTQDTALLSYTTDASIPTQPLPVSSADAEVETSSINLRATSSAWRKVTLEAQFRADRHDNKTPINQYNYVITDTTPAGTPVVNSAYDYERSEAKLRAEYRPWRPLTLSAGLASKQVDRAGQERDRTETDKLWAGLRLRARGFLTFNVDAFDESRDGSDYGLLDNPAAPQNPLLRKYNMADRDRDGARVQLSLLGLPNTDLSLEYETLNDDYDHSAIGLKSAESQRFGIDAAYVFDSMASTYLSLSNEITRSSQQNSQSFATADWAATNRDEFTMAVLGYQHRALLERFDLVFEYSWDRSRGRIENNTSGLRTAFPELEGRRDMVRVGVEFPYRDNLQFGIDYFYERVRNDDWALDGVAPDTIPTLLSLGASAWNYTNNVVYLNVRYQRNESRTR